jgi:hypothetical protein
MKKIFLLLPLFILSFSSFSQEDEQLECIPSGEIQKLSQTVIALSAPLRECPTDDELVNKFVAEEYKKFYGSKPQVSKNVKGFILKGSDKELELANLMLGGKPPKEWAASAKGCSTIQCAFEKLLKSKVAAMEIFNFAAKSGYALSLDQAINQGQANQVWSPREIREMSAAASKMPKGLQSLPHLKVITRMADGFRRSVHSSGVAAYASPAISGYKGAELVMYDAALTGAITKGSAYEQTSWPQEVILHEICHHQDYKGFYATNEGTMTTEQRGSAFAALSGWKEKVGKNGQSSWVHSSSAQFISSYASTEPAEDFAETCANYILHPHNLEKVAPSKYAYMKNKVFPGVEFKDKPWTKSKDMSWPELANLVSSQDGCLEALEKCITDISYRYGMFSSKDTSVTTSSPGRSVTVVNYGTALDQIKKNVCMAEFKVARAKEIEEKLSASDQYCDKGGQAVIRKGSEKICAESEALIASRLEEVVKIDVAPAAKACETEKDYTRDCIMKKAGQSVDVPKGMTPVVESLIVGKIPKRMSALGDNLDAIGTNKWLKSCVENISKVEVYRTTNGGSIFDYKSAKEGYGSSFWPGRNIWEDYDKKDITMSCAESLLGLYEEAGFKVPKGENPANLIKKPFGEEMNSFEQEVLLKVGESTSKCRLKKCKREKVMELLTTWEKQSPEKRSGVADESFVEVLLQKVEPH